MALALVTGATAGFGAAITRRLIRDGYRVIAAGRRVERLEALERELGDAILPLALDVIDNAAVAGLPDSLPEPWREIDLLVNNAGLAVGQDPAFEAETADWDRMVATNVTGLMHVTHAILPGMVVRNRGLVINLGSTAGVFPYPGGHVYGASKAFVAQFTLNLKADLIGTNVRVTCLEPGLVGGTEFSTVRFRGDAQKAANAYKDTTPLSPEDIADTVGWLASLPPHVNVNRIQLMPTCQAPGPLTIKRDAGGGG